MRDYCWTFVYVVARRYSGLMEKKCCFNHSEIQAPQQKMKQQNIRKETMSDTKQIVHSHLHTHLQ